MMERLQLRSSTMRNILHHENREKDSGDRLKDEEDKFGWVRKSHAKAVGGVEGGHAMEGEKGAGW